MALSDDKLSKFRGCLAGSAVGDALGAPLAGLKSERIAQVYGEIEGYVDPVLAWKGRPNRVTLRGLYTSNTQRALVLADILAKDGRCEPAALVEVFLEMADAKVPGAQCGCHRRPSRPFHLALEQMRSSRDDPLACGQPSAGSGAAARAAPVGLFFAGDRERLATTVIETTLVTHRDPRAVAGALAAALAVAGCIASPEKSGVEIAREVAEQVRDGENRLAAHYGKYIIRNGDLDPMNEMSEALSLLPRLLEEGDDRLAFDSIVRQANRGTPDHKINAPGDGFAPAAVTTALYLALGGRSFAEILPLAVGLGRQAHDIGAIVGAVVGAREGVEAIPSAWLDELSNSDQILLRADNLLAREIDYSRWRGIVEMESEASRAEERERRRLAEKWEKQGLLIRKPKKKKPPEQPNRGFAPPPELWLRPKKRERRKGPDSRRKGEKH